MKLKNVLTEKQYFKCILFKNKSVTCNISKLDFPPLNLWFTLAVSSKGTMKAINLREGITQRYQLRFYCQTIKFTRSYLSLFSLIKNLKLKLFNRKNPVTVFFTVTFLKILQINHFKEILWELTFIANIVFFIWGQKLSRALKGGFFCNKIFKFSRFLLDLKNALFLSKLSSLISHFDTFSTSCRFMRIFLSIF